MGLQIFFSPVNVLVSEVGHDYLAVACNFHCWVNYNIWF